MCPEVTLGNVRSVQRQHFYKPPSLIALGFRDLRATASRRSWGHEEITG